MKAIGITFLTACIGGAVAIGTYKLIETKTSSNLSLEEQQKVYFANTPRSVTPSTGDLDFTAAAAAVTPAVVHIKTTYNNSNKGIDRDPFEGMFDDFFGGRGRTQSPVMASGSGVIISDDGYIVTNNHVVENADKIDVILTDKRSFQGKVVGRDPNTDLALIKIQGKGFPQVKLGNSDDTRVGEWVLAVGYPFALNTTVTAGIISAKGRQIGILDQNNTSRSGEPKVRTAIESFIQTDAAINRGNSGGALVNTRGELIGINAAIASQTGSYEGYGFAIPVNLAKKVLDDFIKFGLVKRGYIGVSFRELDYEVAKQLGVEQINGLYVDQVMTDGAADAAGIKKGDIIIKVDGKEIGSSSDLQEKVARLRPGDKVQLTVLRDGKERSMGVTLKGEESIKIAKNGSQSAAEVFNKLGASFAPLNTQTKKKLGISSGMQIADVRSGGLFDQYDVPRGLIVTNINGKQVNSVDDIENALEASSNNMIRISGITSDGARLTMNFPVK